MRERERLSLSHEGRRTNEMTHEPSRSLFDANEVSNVGALKGHPGVVQPFER